jgi:hypothetical protein
MSLRIVTTGGFSKDALEYANGLVNLRIKLIDRPELVDMAERAGYKIVFGVKEEGVFLYREADPEEVRVALRDRLWGQVRQGDTITARGLLTYRYEPFYRFDYDIPQGWHRPYEPKKKGVKWITKGHILMAANRPAIHDPQGIRALMYGGMFEEPSIGVPVQNLEIWNPDRARDNNIPFSEFVLAYEDARRIAQGRGRTLAALKQLPEDAVILRNIYRVMIPTYRYTISTTKGREMEITALFITRPIVLSWGRD